MSDLRQTAEQYILKNHLLAPDMRVLIAVSGGQDSVTLLDILSQLAAIHTFDIHIAHLNHQLRPNAHKDAEFVANLAKKYRIQVTIENRDVRSFARQNKLSIEDAARQMRRRFLKDTAQNVQADRIALGHTLSDQTETMLFRLLRGTSMTGLAGIRPCSENLWIRPLLEVNRQQVEAYVKEHDLPYCTDESNEDLSFARNKIRHELVPILKDEYNTQLEAGFGRLSTLLQSDDDLLEKLTNESFQKVALYISKRKIILDVNRIFGYHISLRRRLIKKALFELGIAPNMVTFDGVERVVKILDESQADVQITADLTAHRNQGFLIFSKPALPFYVPICLSGKTDLPALNARIHATTSVATNNFKCYPTDAQTIFFDADKLPSKLFLRSVAPGDVFQPFGLDGSQKISKLLVDQKIPKCLRDQIPVLIGNDQILWVVGLRRSNRAPITSDTRNVLQLIFEGGWLQACHQPETR